MKTTPRRAIEAFCHQCLGGERKNEDCGAPACALYAFRRKNTGEAIDWPAYPMRQWDAAHWAACKKTPLPERETMPDEQRDAARLRLLAGQLSRKKPLSRVGAAAAAVMVCLDPLYPDSAAKKEENDGSDPSPQEAK